MRLSARQPFNIGAPRERLDFETTDNPEPTGEPVEQQRGLEAMRSGTDIDNQGFNLFVPGPRGVDHHALVRDLLEQRPQQAMSAIGEEARDSGTALMTTPDGFASAPWRDGALYTDASMIRAGE
jgi:hypothetical protein